MDFNDLHPLNIRFISVTEEVSKLDKLIDSNELQPLNIPNIFITEEVLKFN